MKKKLLTAVLALGAMITSSAQNSLIFDGPTPTEVEAGQSITINFTYESDIEQPSSQFEIFLTDSDGIFGGNTAVSIGGGVFPTLAATTGPTSGTATLNVGAGVTPSADLDPGLTYRIFGKLGDDSAFLNNNAPAPEVTVLAATVLPDYDLRYDDARPLIIQRGSSVTINYEYTAIENVSIQFQVFLADSPSIFGGESSTDVAGTFNLVDLPATNGYESSTVTITIAEETELSANLEPGFDYYVFGQLFDPAQNTFRWLLNGESPLMEIVEPTLSTTEFTNDLDEVFYNNSSNSLEIKANLSGKILDIYDLTGKKVQSTSNLNNTSLDVSNLPSGLYIAIIENQFLKFIK